MALRIEGANAGHAVRARQACRCGRAFAGRVRLHTPRLRTLHPKHRRGRRRNRRRAGQRTYHESSLSDWLAKAPRHLLANNFGMPEKSIANFNKKRMVISAAATPT